MKILFLDQFSEMGGAQACLAELLPAICRRGWQGLLRAPGDGPLHRSASEVGMRADSLPLRLYTNSRKSGLDVWRFTADFVRCRSLVRGTVRDEAPDLIYANGPRVLAAATGQGVPVLFHSHSALDKAYSRLIVKHSLQRGPFQVLACSQYLAATLRPPLGEQRVRVVLNGVADLGFRGGRAQEGRCVVGLVGRIAPEKGHFDFLYAAQRLAGVEGLEFVVIGEDRFSTPGYAETVKALGVTLGVKFLGWMSTREAFAKIDILAVPSAAREASGRVVMEGLAAGVAVVAYKSGGIPELIRHGVDGLLCDSDSEALADAIRTVAADSRLRDRLRNEGRRTYLQRFTLERFQNEVCDSLAELAAATGSSAKQARFAERPVKLVRGGPSA